MDINDLNLNQLRDILSISHVIKKKRKQLDKGSKDYFKFLNNKIVALLFKKPSTRTRFSFEVGIFQMGGKTITVSNSEMQLSNLESMSDTANVLSRYVDMVVIRTENHSDILDLIKHSNIPIINGLSDKSHPCQVLSDIFTFEEERGSIKNKKVVWLGDKNNVCNSYIHAAERFEFNLVISAPLELMSFKNNSQNYLFEKDPFKAIENADLVVTDTWYSMHQTKKDRDLRRKIMDKYTLSNEMLSAAKKNCLVFHCMPIYRNNEITSDLVDKFFDYFLKQAENRLHVQKGIMKWCFF